MREIKFRGRSKESYEWIYGSYHKDEATGKSFIMRRIDDVGYQEPVDPETVGQFIGLKDNDSDDVYEGDIVEIFDGIGKKRTCAIEFDCWGFMIVEQKTFGEVSFIGELDVDDLEIKVKGNIHDNPDMLEG